ncbi:MAG: transcriptional regulator [Acidobacteriota bacterium]|nr:transcriptional regulator [Acidobacteriota bacterium]
MATDKKTMTLNLTEGEMAALEKLSTQKELSKTAVLRQALQLYQLVDNRLAQGDTLYFEDKEKKNKSELMVL